MFVKVWAIFLPVRLFPPVCLSVVGKCSSLYVYSILYDYLVLKSKWKMRFVGIKQPTSSNATTVIASFISSSSYSFTNIFEMLQ